MTSVVKSSKKRVRPLHPDDLFEQVSTVSERWWAVYTLARQEKSLARDLLDLGVKYYLPLIESTTAYRRNRVTRQLPLFPGYLFLCGSDEDRVRSLTTNRVSKILDVTDTSLLVRDLSRLNQLIETGAPLTPENQLTAGDPVRIKAGPLAGFEGVVLRRRGEMRLLVSVHFLQQGASVAVEDYMLEPIRRCE